jgi:hypothetical protein
MRAVLVSGIGQIIGPAHGTATSIRTGFSDLVTARSIVYYISRGAVSAEVQSEEPFC